MREGGVANCVTYKGSKPIIIFKMSKREGAYTAPSRRKFLKDLLDFFWDLSPIEIITTWAKSTVSSHVTAFLKLLQDKNGLECWLKTQIPMSRSSPPESKFPRGKNWIISIFNKYPILLEV